MAAAMQEEEEDEEEEEEEEEEERARWAMDEHGGLESPAAARLPALMVQPLATRHG